MLSDDRAREARNAPPVHCLRDGRLYVLDGHGFAVDHHRSCFNSAAARWLWRGSGPGSLLAFLNAYPRPRSARK